MSDDRKFLEVKRDPPYSGQATIGSWHSYHMEGNSKGEAIAVTDGFSDNYFEENPTHSIMTREDGTWGPDPRSSLIITLPEDDEFYAATYENYRRQI